MQRIAMFDTKPYDKPGFERYLAQYGVEIKYLEPKLNEDTVDLAKGYDGVVVFVNDSLSGEVIDRLHGLGVRMIALRCAGYNNVDVARAFRKIHIYRVPAYSPHAVAEHAMAMLLTSIRRIHKAFIRTRDFNFSLNGMTGFNLYGKTAGVVGTGKIGKVFVDICRGFGMKVLAYDPFPQESAGIDYVPLDDLFAASDIISLHCPLTQENWHMVNSESIARMKRGVILINTSRGALIDAEALLDAIKRKYVGAACLDVYEEESDFFFEDFSGHIVQDDVLARLLSMPNVIITSHQGFLTEEALNNIAETTVKNIVDFFDGRTNLNEICYRCDQQPKFRKDNTRCF